ncbi:MAG: hypothetical protein LKG27_03675 [Clostridiaceae bacterium]|jgi:hypothetical protein|nr:hypothetical protein [Clostridiaceae bacterium]
MGMAASQARFLSLTARKNNTEYEGQQVNQQRTTLSNESANYYNQLMGMTVPTPPSSADYTKTTYTFTDGAMTNTVTSMIAEANGNYKVNYTSSYTDYSAIVSASSSVVTKTTGSSKTYAVPSSVTRTISDAGVSTYSYKDSNNDNYNVSLSTLTAASLSATEKAALGLTADDTTTAICGFSYTDGNNATHTIGYTKQSNIDTDTSKGTYTYAGYLDTTSDTEFNIGAVTLRTLGTATKNAEGKYGNTYLDSLDDDEITALLKQESQYVGLLNSKYGNQTWLVRYTYNSTEKSYTPTFYSYQELTSKNINYDKNGNSESSIPAYTVGQATVTKELKNKTAQFEKDSSGRLISITLNPGDEDEVTYSLTTNTSTDQAKYNDAMNQYEYNKNEYDQEVQNINAKIETVQAEDKNLELRLKQLDTEQNAISTELDAVKKVIEKNVESSFKTFG